MCGQPLILPKIDFGYSTLIGCTSERNHWACIRALRPQGSARQAKGIHQDACGITFAGLDLTGILLINAELGVDGNYFLGFPEVPPRLVAGRAPFGPGAAFPSANCLFSLGIWAQSSR
jgi:hypothetical protein